MRPRECRWGPASQAWIFSRAAQFRKEACKCRRLSGGPDGTPLKNRSMARGRPWATLPPFGWAAACSPVGVWPCSGVVRCGCRPVAAYAETYSQSGNALIYKCNRLAIDGKPVGRAEPEGWATNAKGRMQSMLGTASAWVFKMASREGGRVRGAAVPRRLCVRGRLLLADCLPRGRSASFLGGNCGKSRGCLFAQP